MIALATERDAAGQPLRVVILEVGAGNNVPTVRSTANRCLRKFLKAGAEAEHVRINAAEPLADFAGYPHKHPISIMEKGLAALTKMQETMPVEMRREFVAGSCVEVATEFQTDSHPAQTAWVGQTGTVQRVDDGGAWIHFEGTPSPQWVNPEKLPCLILRLAAGGCVEEFQTNSAAPTAP